jgi:ubiquinone/menaquinone biosynthesis C-methylase UbiE
MMAISQAQLVRAGYAIKAAPVDSWRSYDEDNPVPGYFEFDWFSARHPDLYHKFAISTDGLMAELEKLVDLSGLVVADLGAGTGRSSLQAAKAAKQVYAIDVYESVVDYASSIVKRAGVENITYIRADNRNVPLADNSIDATLCSWAVQSSTEAYRVLKPGGWMISMGAPLEALCGELTATLADSFPELISDVASDALYDPTCPPLDSLVDGTVWEGIPFVEPMKIHDFTYVADYGDPLETAATYGRLYGPKAKKYILDWGKSAVSWRLRIQYGRVKK